MEQVLYRKYRPNTFANVQGQPHVVDTLISAIKFDKLAHAYLFTGPRGTGKTTTARLLAKAANCINFTQQGDVCNTCELCVSFEAGTNIDLIEIDAASNRGIEEIRQLKENINYAPTAGKHKVYIIDEVHMLTKEAFNALLKTLEEPPKQVLFILATTEPHKVPNTILSRVQRFDFKLASETELTFKLKQILSSESVTAEPEVLTSLYEYAEGSYRDAESLLGKLLSDSSGHISVEKLNTTLGIPEKSLIDKFVSLLLAKHRQESLAMLASIDSKGLSWNQLTKEVLSSLRKSVLNKAENNQPYLAELELLKRVLQLVGDMRQVSQVKVLWEVLCLELANTPTAAAVSPIPTPASPKVSEPAKSEDPQPIEEAQFSDTDMPMDTEPQAKPKAIQSLERSLILDQWPSVVVKIRERSSRIGMLLAGAVAELGEDKLLIKTKFKYNHGVLNQTENKHLIAEVLIANLGDIQFEIVLSTDLPELTRYNEAPQIPSNADLVESLF